MRFTVSQLFPRLFAPCVAVAVVLFLVACSGGEEDPGPFCPEGAIINGLDQIESFAPPVESTNTLRYSVSLGNVAGQCTYQNDRLTLSYTVDVTAQRGPALADPEVSVPYFVTVLDDKGDVISKDLLTASFTLTEEQPIVTQRDEIEQVIDALDPGTGRFYSVYFGFQNNAQDALRRRNRNL